MLDLKGLVKDVMTRTNDSHSLKKYQILSYIYILKKRIENPRGKIISEREADGVQIPIESFSEKIKLNLQNRQT